LEVREDRHFICSTEAFRVHAEGRKQLRQEFFYRELRKRTGVLLDPEGRPLGGSWNFDAENRSSFARGGPEGVPPVPGFAPDAVTRKVLKLVQTRFADHPGSLEHFDWPVTRAEALAALDDFIQHRLPGFGRYQDAMWTGRPFLWHALLSGPLNLKLLDPMEAVQAAEEAYRRDPDRIPLAAAEGFIRQILGWREYVRGVYWRFMPEYLERNALGAEADLPGFYWTGETDMACLREVIGQTLDYGYAHHIQRLMVTGLFSLLLGVDPRRVHGWYLAVYLDAVEWVELPNTLGISQFADGGIMASKPYAASGQYVNRMSNYCRACRFKPADRGGDQACPFTVLYWDFLLRHREQLGSNPRMRMQLRNLERLAPSETRSVRSAARGLRQRLS
jgi:deoxyribodipyrimidine photolyase-related protein